MSLRAFFSHGGSEPHGSRKFGRQSSLHVRSLRVEALEHKLCLSLPGFYGAGMVTSESEVYRLDADFDAGTLTPHHLGTLFDGDSLAPAARDDAVRPGYPGGSFLCVADNPTDPLGLPSMLRSTDIDVFQRDTIPAPELTVTNLGELWMVNPLPIGPTTIDVRLNALEWTPAMDGLEPVLFGAGYAGVSGSVVDMIFSIDPDTLEASPEFDLSSIGVESAGEITFDLYGIYLSLVGGDILRFDLDTLEHVVHDLPLGTPDFDALFPYFDVVSGNDLVGITQDHDYYGINLTTDTVEFGGTISHPTNPDWLDSSELIYGATLALEDPLDAGTISGIVDATDITPRLGQLWYEMTAGSTGPLSIDLISGTRPATAMMLYDDINVDAPIATGQTQVTTDATAGEVFYLHAVDLEHNGSVDLRFENTTSPAENLGPVDYIELVGLDPSTGDRLYQCQTTQAGFVSAKADYDPTGGEVVLILSDAFETPVDSSATGSGIERTDAFAISSGEDFFIRLSGANPDVDLTIANLVDYVGNEVTVSGTTSADDFLFFPEGDGYGIDIKGFDYYFGETELDTVDFDGGQGDDWASLEVVDSEDSITMDPFTAAMTGTDYAVFVSNTPGIVAFGGGKEFGCRAYLNDSDGDDILDGSPEVTELYGTTADGQFFSNRAEGFYGVYGYARHGGYDEAFFADSAGKDKFKVNGESKWALMREPGYRSIVRAKFFEEVTATSENGGNDKAQYFDSDGDDVFEILPRDWATLVTLDAAYWAEMFDDVTAYGRNGGYDQAIFHDTIVKDKFIGRLGKAWMFDHPLREYNVIARSFDDVTLNATAADDDVARLKDSGGADLFVARPNTATLSGATYSITVNDCANVRMMSYYSDNSTEDHAELYDTAIDDLVEASGSSATLSTDDGQGGWDLLYEVVAFDRVRAIGTAGGTNTLVETPPLTFLLEWEGSWL